MVPVDRSKATPALTKPDVDSRGGGKKKSTLQLIMYKHRCRSRRYREASAQSVINVWLNNSDTYSYLCKKRVHPPYSYSSQTTRARPRRAQQTPAARISPTEGRACLSRWEKGSVARVLVYPIHQAVIFISEKTRSGRSNTHLGGSSSSSGSSAPALCVK